MLIKIRLIKCVIGFFSDLNQFIKVIRGHKKKCTLFRQKCTPEFKKLIYRILQIPNP